MDEDLIAELENRLDRQPPERYPIQHATTLFHLGTVRFHGGDVDGAILAFGRSVELFQPLPLERAKSSNMRGIALREAGRSGESVAAFEEAAAAFAIAGATVEEAAARYNLGLVHAQLGQPASEDFASALDLFRTAGASRQASAAARELGQAHLVEGDLDEAVSVLTVAVATAEACGDEAGRGSAANALGLSKLAAGAPEESADAFRLARAAHPRSVRPSQHAMATANLSLALERTGDISRARLAARQARAVPDADRQVRQQCEELLGRNEDRADDLVVVLREEPADQWPVLLRDELERWVDDSEDERGRSASALAEELASTGVSDDLAEAVLGAALELPPARIEAVMGALSLAVARLAEVPSARAASRLSRASARFHVPQMMRLEHLLRSPNPDGH